MPKWMRNAKIASTLGFLILIMLIWFVGPLLGLKTVESRFGWIFAVMFLWVVTLLVGQVVSQRAGGLVERLLLRQADDAVMSASPEKRAEVTLLRQRMLSAIDTLKTSKLGKARGKAALYELPWYMIIGHPAAGKSTAILQSGLSFPFSDKNGVKGVGGTRNCDWFFSTEGVLLDTAGRYATQAEDRGEWLAFLKLLKKYRAKAPVNGIIVSISLPELLQYKTEGFAIYARQIRERIYEMEDSFGIRVPIYLLFTKVDLLGGFTQFFEDFQEEERCRPWGATLTHDQGAGFNLTQVVGQQLEVLYKGLVQIGEDKLVGNRSNANRPALFAFPLEFHALKEPIARFVELLHEEDPYHSKPLIRGFYFTSALQEGVPRIGAGNRVSSQFDLSRAGFETNQPASSYSFFLRDWFREVLFPDQHLVSRQTKPAVTRLRIVSIFSGLAVLAVLVGSLSWSYIGNQKLMITAQEEMEAARKLSNSPEAYDRLKAMQVLQLRLEQLYTYRKEGRPWNLGMGLYRGDALERALRAEYFAGARKLMLEPVKANLERSLAQLPSDGKIPGPAKIESRKAPEPKPAAKPAKKSLPTIELGANWDLIHRATAEAKVQDGNSTESGYNALKSYLMLHDVARMEAVHLTDQLPRYWRSWLEANHGSHSQEEINFLAERMVAFYVSQISEPDLPVIDNGVEVIAHARDVLRSSMRQLSANERVYNELKARANTRFAPLTVGRILNGKEAGVVGGSNMVAGAFTREAWEQYFDKAILEASKGEIKSDDWVLAISTEASLGQGDDVKRNREEIEKRYRADYIREWKKFLQGVTVQEFADLESAAKGLTPLADTQNSPTRLILARAARETSWDNPSELKRSMESAKTTVLERTEKLLGSADGNKPNASQYGEVGGQFAYLERMVTVAPGATPAIQGYLELLGKLKAKVAQVASADEPGTAARQLMQSTLNGSGSELHETLQYVDNTLLAGVSDDAKDTLRPLLVRPLIQTFSALIGPVESEINRAWTREVYGQWGNLAGKYPFADSSNEAPMADIAKFLKPGEGVLAKFMDKYLNGLAVRRGDAYVSRTWAGMGVRFNSTFLVGVNRLITVSTGLLQEGDGAKFELQPIPSPGISEILVEIDGQVMRYRNGPQPWIPFGWPNVSGAQGARIQVVYFNGTTVPVATFSGRLGLMRLLAQGSIDNPNASTSQVAWKIKKSGDRDETDLVRVNYRMVSGANPLRLSDLRRQSLPEKITF